MSENRSQDLDLHLTVFFDDYRAPGTLLDPASPLVSGTGYFHLFC